VFVAASESLSDKIYLLAVACGGCVLSTSVAQGKEGFKLQYQKAAFNRLRDFHLGIHCSRAFRSAHPAFMKVLAWVVDTTGWHKVKVESLDKMKSISLVAAKDPEATSLKKKSKMTFEKLGFVRYLTQQCEAKDKSFLVAAL
jgi:hypothetical protein